MFVMPYSDKFAPRDGDLFRSLEFKDSRQRSVVMSVVVHGVILSVLLIIPLLFTEAIKLHFDTVLIAPPPPHKQILEVTHYKAPPPPKVQHKPEKPLVPPPVKPVVVEPPKPKPEPPKIVETKKPEVIEREKPTPIMRNTPKLDTVAPEAPAPKLE